MTKITLSVCKVFKNAGKRHSHRKKTKPAWKHYFLSDDWTDELTFGTEWVNSIKAKSLKFKKRHRRKFICTECYSIFIAYVKNDREKAFCPYCEDD